MNILKTGVLLVVLTMLLVWIGGYFGGRVGATYAFMFALAINIGAYWFSDKIVLRMYGAKEAKEEELPELYNMVRELAGEAKIPAPRVYIAPQSSPNAFATGRNPAHAVVCVTQGILNILNREELKGVIAHELSHIKHRDTLIMSVVAAIAGAITMIANSARWAMIFGGYGGRGRNRDNNMLGYLFMLIVAPIAALLIQLAISRSREYAADERGGRISKNPMYLANALLKLEKAKTTYPMHANHTTAHLFIVNPLKGGGLANLFSTHPPIEKRVERLNKMTLG